MLSVHIIALVWMIAFHFYMELKFDRLRSDLINMSRGNPMRSTDIRLPSYHVQQIQPQAHGSADSASLLPTVAEIASNAPVSSGQLLPAYEDSDVYARFTG